MGREEIVSYQCKICWSGNPEGYRSCQRPNCPYLDQGNLQHLILYGRDRRTVHGDTLIDASEYFADQTHGDSPRRLSPRFPTPDERREKSHKRYATLFGSLIGCGAGIAIASHDHKTALWGIAISLTGVIAGVLYGLAVALRRPS
jgi:hypothetical protein